VLPHALPFIVTALRLAIPIAMIGTILAELLGATAGLGHMLAEQGTFLAVDKMMATLATIAACVIVFRLWLLPLERWIARQQGNMKTGGTTT
ncbi:MAG: ABC transporter permease subunit, partial [Rhizomicrobium sp.]